MQISKCIESKSENLWLVPINCSPSAGKVIAKKEHLYGLPWFFWDFTGLFAHLTIKMIKHNSKLAQLKITQHNSKFQFVSHFPEQDIRQKIYLRYLKIYSNINRNLVLKNLKLKALYVSPTEFWAIWRFIRNSINIFMHHFFKNIFCYQQKYFREHHFSDRFYWDQQAVYIYD